MKSVILMAAFCFGAFAQDIWVSKDSVRVPGVLPNGWVNDSFTIKNLGSSPVWLDSAKIAVALIDSGFMTDLLGRNLLQLNWAEYHEGIYLLDPFWTLRSAGAGDYLLTDMSASSAPKKTLSMDGQGDSIVIKNMQIGSCFWCDMVEYPKYFRGTLRLFFNNGQTISLTLYCPDLRTYLHSAKVLVRQRAAVHKRRQPCLANGQRVAREWIELDRKRIRQFIY